jgi:cyclic beta-1,2-glucan synthetase
VPALPEEKDRTLFHWITSGQCGIDPYAAAVSDVYQDLFREGSFSGKGIYDVDAFDDSLRGRIPDNTLLSHDLFEGTFARAGLLSDVEVLEEFPSHYDAFASRQHRWARGDWQLLPWILGRRGKGMPFLGRWKMLDNLRRSLVPPCAFLSLALGWILAPQVPVAWTAMVLVAMSLPFLVSASEAISPPQSGIAIGRYLRDIGENLLQAVSNFILNIVLLAHQAWMLTDAMVRTLSRMLITKGRMLEWVTAAQASTRRGTRYAAAYRNMAAAALLPIAVAICIGLLGRGGNLALAAPLIGIWLASPALALLAGSPRRPGREETLTPRERLGLRYAALKTWRFFREFVGPQDNFLPPDNFQEDPNPVIAHRTSPTNMGLCLLSVSTARDLGWLGLGETARRMGDVLDSMGRLERYRGHFYNWYGTRDLRPLEPRYISTVDSGNLAGHLLVLGRACREYTESEILSPSLEEGLADLIQLVKEAALALPPDLRIQAFGRRHMLEALEALEGMLLPVPTDAAEWSTRVKGWEAMADAVVDVARTIALEQAENGTAELQSRAEFLRGSLAGLAEDIEALFPWAASGLTLEALCDLPLPAAHRMLHGRLTPVELEAGCLAAAAEVRALPLLGADDAAEPLLPREKAAAFAEGLVASARSARALMDKFSALAEAADRMAMEMDFNFLLDPQRKLFAIGFRVREEALDPSFYDLLASEARLTSFLAVAKGDVPPSHWFRLPHPDAGGEGRYPALLVRVHVRIPDAAAGNALPARQSHRNGLPLRGAAADRIRKRSRHTLGHFRGCLQHPRFGNDLPVLLLRGAGPWPQARPLRRSGGGALCNRARRPGGAAPGRRQSGTPTRRRRGGKVRVLRGHRLHQGAAAGQVPRHHGESVFRAPPRHDAGGPGRSIAGRAHARAFPFHPHDPRGRSPLAGTPAQGRHRTACPRG